MTQVARLRTGVTDLVHDTVDRARAAPMRVVLAEIALLVVCGVLEALDSLLLTGRSWEQTAGLTALLTALLLLRRVLPSAAAFVGVPLMTAWGLTSVTALVLVYWAAYRSRWQRAATATALGLGAGVLLGGGPLVTAVELQLLLLGLLVPFLIGRYAAQRRQLAQAVEWQDRQVRRERALLVAQARLRERSRIAQDVHDGLGHRMSLVSLLTGVIEQHPGLPDDLRGTVGALHSAAHTAVDDLRDAIGALGPGSATDNPGGHTAEEIPELVAAARAAGADVSYQPAQSPPELAATTSHAAYRVVQEGLTNTRKHAAGAAVTVTVTHERDTVLVEVRNGPPSAPAAASGTRLGLVGLAERVRLAGGVLHSGPTSDGGFRVAAMLPYDTAQSLIADGEDDEGQAAEPIRRPSVHAGTGALLAVGMCVLALPTVLIWATVQDETDVVPREVYEAVEVGQDEAEVIALLPEPTAPALTDLRAEAPPEPEGATCRYHLADEQIVSTLESVVFRFCFADGVLVEKQSHTQM